MSRFVIIKNGKLVGRVNNAAQARARVLEDLQKNPRATYEVARLVRRISADETPPSFNTVEEDLGQ